ncbi:MAG: diaminopimelate decarboxylase [Burkholderiales bacterium]
MTRNASLPLRGKYFSYHGNDLYVEEAPLSRIAQRYGTPCYVYSRAAITDSYCEFSEAFTRRQPLICYAVKANPSLAVLNALARLGSGFDIVSGGELQRVLAAGGDAHKTVFSGVGKSQRELEQALNAGVLCFNVESESELSRLAQIARRLSLKAPVALRINPHIDAKTHPYIATGLKHNKFGIAYHDARRLYRWAHDSPHLNITGIAFHIGSQMTSVAPLGEATGKILYLVDRLQSDGIEISHLDIGGGFGVRYSDETPPPITAFAKTIDTLLGPRPQRLLLAPGRALVANSGALLTTVLYLKHGNARNFAIVDAAMNDLMRPALYGAYHAIVPAHARRGRKHPYEIVGPVCESSDFLGHARMLDIAEGDLLAVLTAGAYGMSMASNYNSRPSAAETMVDGRRVHLIRKRQDAEQLWALERKLPSR